ILAWFWVAVVDGRLDDSKAWRWLKIGLCTGCGLVAIILLVLLVHPYLAVPPVLRDLYSPSTSAVVFGLLGLTLFVSAWWLLKAHQISRGFYTLAVGTALAYSLCNWGLLPMAARLVQEDIVIFAQKTARDGKALATYKIKKPSLVFYSQGKVDYVLNETT